MLIRVHPVTPQPRIVAQAAQVLDRDGVLVYPTESGYAIGVSTGSPKAMSRLYKLTDPVKSKTLSLLFHDFSQVSGFADVSNFAFRTMKHLVPGPYTFILPAKHKTAKLLGVKRPEVGVRLPEYPFLRALLEAHPHPLLNAAARFSERSEEIFEDPTEIEDQYGRMLDLVVDAGPIIPTGTTIVSLINDETQLVRSGIGPLAPLGLEDA
jgi:tRNA threonylcarbamoyl adenosine modification protein (Sua5/YciO/YrdC/YwlC family)